jgi:hypothetical protein
MANCLGVELTQAVRPPVTDPTLGIVVQLRPTDGNPAHRLVTLGDSLTHGFHHVAIFDTELSWPALVAEQLGIDLAYPHYDKNGPGGHPLNLERVAHLVDGDLVESLFKIRKYLGQVEKYYTTSPGSDLPNQDGRRNENLAIWGWDLRDVLMRTADTELAMIGGQHFSLLPMVSGSGHRAAVLVLNSARGDVEQALTPVGAAKELGDEPGGIETLCVWLGANNVLGSVIDLKPRLSGPDYQDLDKKSAYNVWTIADFTAELELLVDEIRQVKATHVLWATVPHVTIPPVTRGLGGVLPGCGRYFNYYAHLWQTDQTFDPNVDAHLTGQQAWAIDIMIDGYNLALQRCVAQARHDGLDWQIVDLCAVLDRLAVRRNDELNARPAEFAPYPLPEAYSGLDTQFFTTDDAGMVQTGGLIGLDGIHPTTAGYGIVAQEFINVMAGAGVEFEKGTTLDFANIRERDTLLSNPPARINDVLELIRRLDTDLSVLKRLDPFE